MKQPLRLRRVRAGEYDVVADHLIERPQIVGSAKRLDGSSLPWRLQVGHPSRPESYSINYVRTLNDVKAILAAKGAP
jgi:hypothetical protein